MPAGAIPRKTLEQVLPLAILSLQAKKGRLTSLKKPAPPKNPLEWAQRYRRIDGHPFSLERFRPLEAIYTDPHPHLVIIKPAQRGVSEFAINYASFGLECGAEVWAPGLKDGINVAYIFPTVEALGDFSKERLSGLEDESYHLARLFGEHDDFNAVRFKQVGRSYLYLRGGWSTRALKSFPADMLILDEFDEMEPKAIALARRRMNASIIRREVDISTPTIPGYGIHAEYNKTDQRVYRQRHRCGAWVGYDFFTAVRVDNRPYSGSDGWQYFPPEQLARASITLHCPSCDGVVTEQERLAPGEWGPLEPSITHTRGYHVPWWPFPVVDLTRYAIAAVNTDPTELEQFYQSDLGLPHSAAGARVTIEALLALSSTLPNGRLPEDVKPQAVTLGADVGTRLHYRVSGLVDGVPTVLDMGSVREFSDLDELMERWNVRLAVLDSMPEQHGVADFCERWRGRAIAAGYPANAASLKSSMLGPNKDGQPHRDQIMATRHVQVNRTMAMDDVSAAVRSCQEVWPAEFTHDPEIQQHMIAPVRVTTVDASGQPKAAWVHTKPDHFFHACVYDRVARALVVAPAAASEAAPTLETYHASGGLHRRGISALYDSRRVGLLR